MAISEGLTLFRNAFGNTEILGWYTIIPFIIVFLTMVLITSEPQKWKTLLLPVTWAWWIAGLNTTFILWVIAGILFASEIMTTQLIGEIIGTKTKQAGQIQQIISKERIKGLTRGIRRTLTTPKTSLLPIKMIKGLTAPNAKKKLRSLREKIEGWKE